MQQSTSAIEYKFGFSEKMLPSQYKPGAKDTSLHIHHHSIVGKKIFGEFLCGSQVVNLGKDFRWHYCNLESLAQGNENAIAEITPGCLFAIKQPTGYKVFISKQVKSEDIYSVVAYEIALENFSDNFHAQLELAFRHQDDFLSMLELDPKLNLDAVEFTLEFKG